MTATAVRNLHVPRVLRIGRGALPELPRLVSQGFDLEKVCVVTGQGPSHPYGAAVAGSLQVAGVPVVVRPVTEGSLTEAATLAAEAIGGGWSLLVAVGGGRVIDTAKLTAARTGLELVSVPTTAAHDGLSSPVATLIGHDGLRRSHAARMPAGVVLDTTILRQAPARTLRAGVGDLISNLTALLDWREADRLGLDVYDEFAAMIAESAARPALDLLDPTDDAALEQLSRGLVMSGLAMAAAGTSRPCSGAEHLVSHSLDALLGRGAALHGEQVALGCLLAATAHGVLDREVRKAFLACQVPTSPAELGISRRTMVAAVTQAAATRPERWTVLSSAVTGEASADALCREAFGVAW